MFVAKYEKTTPTIDGGDEETNNNKLIEVIFELGQYGLSNRTLVYRVKKGETINNLPIVNTKEGYTFLGWSIKDNKVMVLIR